LDPNRFAPKLRGDVTLGLPGNNAGKSAEPIFHWQLNDAFVDEEDVGIPGTRKVEAFESN